MEKVVITGAVVAMEQEREEKRGSEGSRRERKGKKKDRVY